MTFELNNKNYLVESDQSISYQNGIKRTNTFYNIIHDGTLAGRFYSNQELSDQEAIEKAKTYLLRFNNH